MQTIRQVFGFFLLLLSTAWWLSDPTDAASLTHVFAWRAVLLQYTGVLAIGVMALALVLAVRPVVFEPWLGGLDKMYRLHKWLGITALLAAVTHWWLAQGTKWMVGWGWIVRPPRGPRPVYIDPLEIWLRAQRHLAENLGEWAFYGAALLIVVALVKRIPYHWFAKTHQLIAIAYLVLVFHTLVLLKFSYWTQPVAWLVAMLLLAGTVAALLSLTGRIRARRVVPGQVVSTQRFAPLRVVRTTIALQPGWPGHAPGQFAFVTGPGGLEHPFTIASAWDTARRQISFVTKALGDHTSRLYDELAPGDAVKVQGPYGCFTFDDGAARQIWVGGGIGITPFIARMEDLAAERSAVGGAVAHPPVTLFHTTRDEDARALALLAADARTAGVELHVLVDARDGHLSGEHIRAAVPDWREASLWFCGPAGFGQALRRDFIARGLPPARFHQELFAMR